MNKKKIACLLALCFGSVMGIGTYGITKTKQKKARAEGIHIPHGPYEAVWKRPFDFFLSVLALFILGPVMIVTAILVRIKLGKPVLFIQERPGMNEKIFKILKYRSMVDKRNSNGKLLSDEERLTGFGKKIRSMSLDELPELINILKGDMSFVGPRPLLVDYLSRYNEKQKHRHDVRPGLTGLAQISGRNTLPWKEKFEDDIKYIENITLWSDLKIMWNTIATVIKGDGINSETSATMEVFMGNEEGSTEV